MRARCRCVSTLLAAAPGVFSTMRQADAEFGATHDPAEVARVLGVPLEALDSGLPIQTVSTGMPFVMVPFRSQAALEQLAIPQTLAQPWLAGVGVRFFFCVAPADADSGAGSGADFHNRMQFLGVEDPATGSASGCAIAWLVRYGVVARAAGRWCSSRALRWGGHRELMCGRRSKASGFTTCLWGAAPFRLQAEHFHSGERRLLHSRKSRNCNVGADFEKNGGRASRKPVGFA